MIWGKNENFDLHATRATYCRHCRSFRIQLLKIYLLGSNVSNLENRTKRQIHSTLLHSHAGHPDDAQVWKYLSHFPGRIRPTWLNSLTQELGLRNGLLCLTPRALYILFATTLLNDHAQTLLEIFKGLPTERGINSKHDSLFWKIPPPPTDFK